MYMSSLSKPSIIYLFLKKKKNVRAFSYIDQVDLRTNSSAGAAWIGEVGGLRAEVCSF